MPAAKNFIDELVFANLKQVGVPPSPVCDDATFLRRVSLDIAGRLPTAEETQAFLSSTDPDKRDRLIESLLSSPDYADYFANKWTALLRNKRDDTSDITANFAFHSWVRDSLLANKPYDQIVRELLAATGTIADNPPVAWYKRVQEPQQQLEDVAQLFLGVRMQCAQCHHHPFEHWSQDDYYSLGGVLQPGRPEADGDPGRGRDLPQARHGPAGEQEDEAPGEARGPGRAHPGDSPGRGPAPEAGRLDERHVEPVLREVAGEPLLEALLQARASSSPRTTSARRTRRRIPSCWTPWPSTSSPAAST